ncbi:type VII secretion protein EccCa [Nocardioides yefusunii]|uniref:Type VII secretion protein EccCa n=1 Tax=Nocardioides yefusunii TaxID=2500546 RepID=A0ABW1QYX0_9ACTN|nr:type VII secretion protein EccCa [Nocardioides yefusunii]
MSVAHVEDPETTSARALPTEEVLLPSAPVLPEPEAGANLTVLMPLTGALGSVAMVMGVAPGGSASRALLMAGSVLVSAGLMVLVQVTRQRTQRARVVSRAREEHLRLLAARGQDLRERRRHQADEQRRVWPAPAALHTVPHTVPHAVPHTDPQDAARGSALQVRLGLSTRRAPTTVLVDPPAPGVVDPVCRRATERFEAAHDSVDAMPVVVDLASVDQLVVDVPDRDDTLRALVLQSARLSPAEVAVAVMTDAEALPRWDWLKWLPHARDLSTGDVLLDLEAEPLIAARPPGRHLVLVDARAHLPEVPAQRIDRTTLVTGPRPVTPESRSLRITTASGTRLAQAVPDVDGVNALVPDRCSPALATAVARRLASRGAPAAPPAHTPAAMQVDLVTRPRHDLLTVLVAHTPAGDPVHLDLKESAHGGHGPHGLLVGATGSGKSEFLRTLVMGIVTTHLPEDVALVLVDFKGGATFSDLDALPHVAACVTNLSGAVGLVDRMQDAVGGEMERRQELLHATGFPNVTDYRAARAAGAELEPLPHLFVCVDEFSELLAARPEFVELFTAVGRLGRSLGIHLLLASQRLDEGRLHALEAHLSYRIALRTFSASESRAAIGVPDAHELPRRPGVGLFRSGAEAPVRFDAVHLGAPAPDASPARGPRPRVEVLTALTRPSSHSAPLLDVCAPQQDRTTLDRTTLGEQLLSHLHDAAADLAPARRIWLPPLDFTVDLGSLTPDVTVDPDLGLHSPRLRSQGGLRLPVGLVDRPRMQRHDALGLDLTGPRGHVAVVGAPRSGRSTAVQTLVSALALARTPAEAHLHLVDLGGGSLSPLALLPHVVSHVTRDSADLLPRVVDVVEGVVEERERRRAEGLPREIEPEVFLVIDGWGVLRAEHDDLERRLVHLAARALGAGVHLVVTAVRWSELRPAFLDVVGSRLELRLGDAYESVVDRRAAAVVPVDLPGRGIAADPGGSGAVTTRLAHPRLFAGEHTAPPVEVTCRAVAHHWHGPLPERLRELPETVTPADLTAPAPGVLRLGVDEAGRTISTAAGRHLVVQGPVGSGRTTSVRHLVAEWMQAVPSGQVVLLDPRGTLDGVVEDAHLLDHATTATEASSVVRAVAEHLLRRAPEAETPPVPVLVAVDDLELLRDLGGDLTPLTPLLARAESFGLTVIVAARTSPHRAPDRLVGLLGDLGATRISLTGMPAGRASVWATGGTEARAQLPVQTSAHRHH